MFRFFFLFRYYVLRLNLISLSVFAFHMGIGKHGSLQLPVIWCFSTKLAHLWTFFFFTVLVLYFCSNLSTRPPLSFGGCEGGVVDKGSELEIVNFGFHSLRISFTYLWKVMNLSLSSIYGLNISILRKYFYSQNNVFM